jgi:hypothetical protein
MCHVRAPAAAHDRPTVTLGGSCAAAAGPAPGRARGAHGPPHRVQLACAARGHRSPGTHTAVTAIHEAQRQQQQAPTYGGWRVVGVGGWCQWICITSQLCFVLHPTITHPPTSSNYSSTCLSVMHVLLGIASCQLTDPTLPHCGRLDLELRAFASSCGLSLSLPPHCLSVSLTLGLADSAVLFRIWTNNMPSSCETC